MQLSEARMITNNVNLNCTVVETTTDKDGVWAKVNVPTKQPFNILVFFTNERKIPELSRGDKLLVIGGIYSMDGNSFHVRAHQSMKVSEF